MYRLFPYRDTFHYHNFNHFQTILWIPIWLKIVIRNTKRRKLTKIIRIKAKKVELSHDDKGILFISTIKIKIAFIKKEKDESESIFVLKSNGIVKKIITIIMA